MEHNNNFLKTDFNPNNYNILILEDSKSINKILTEEFEDKGYNCFSAFSIGEAREVYGDNEIHYIMLDLNLPDGDGRELIHKFEDTPTKIFVLTAENNKKLINESYKKGIIDFIHKDKDFFHKIENITKTIECLEKNKLSTILVIDDSKIIQSQLEELLENRHYNVQVCDNSYNAYKLMQNEDINLIILDVELKNSKGLIFLKENNIEIINKRKIPVIMLSEELDSSIIRDSLKLGAVDVIKKPFIPEEIILKVNLWIDYKRKETEIEKSSKLLNQYKETVDRSSIVYKTDPDGTIIYVNDEFCKVSEYKKEELIGEKLDILRHKDMKEEFFQKLWNTIKNKKKAWKGKIRNRKKSGKTFWISTIINPILDHEDQVIEYIAISKDITQNEMVQDFFKNQLNTSAQNLEHAISKANEYKKAMYSSNIISRTDLRGKITFANDQFCIISGYTREELIGKKHSIVRHEDMKEKFFEDMWHSIKRDNIWKGIIKNRSKKGDTYWVDTTIVPIKDKNHNIIEYMSIRNDLTKLYELHDEIENTQKEIIYRMGEIGETRSNETGNHVKRVALYSKLLSKLYGQDNETTDLLFTASPMHDIGKVGIQDSILKKTAKLTTDEFEIMKTHAQIGYNILKGSERKVIKAAAIVSHEHHEKWNGEGYPRGLKGEEIHIFGRITAIADVFDALGSHRYYKKSWPDKAIFAYLKEEKGISFDPNLIDLFFENKEKFIQIRNQYID